MMTLILSDIRRIFRRRLSRLIPIVPLLLLIWAAVARWTHSSLPRSVAVASILASAFAVFAQMLLSDREGRLELSLACAPAPGWLIMARRFLLLAIPFAAQFLLLRLLLGLFRLS